MNKSTLHKVIGGISAVINLLPLVDMIHLSYLYTLGSVVFLVKLPIWYRLLVSFLSILGAVCSLLLYKEKIRFWHYIVAMIIIWLPVAIINAPSLI